MRTVAIVLLISVCISLSGCTDTIDTQYVEVQGEHYVWNGKTYLCVSGICRKDRMIAKTSDGIKIYGITNDPQHYFLIDSLGDLYVQIDYEAVESDITGAFLEGNYCNDQSLLEFLSKLRAETAGDATEILKSEETSICKVFNTSDSCSIYLCYDNIEASADTLGYIEHQTQGYLYIDMETIKNTPLADEEAFYRGVLINPDYNEILDQYFD